MRIDFDIFDIAETPNMTLHNPNLKLLHNIGVYKEFNITLRYNAMSEISFNVPKDSNIEYYDNLEPKRIIKVENMGLFTIVSAKEINNGIEINKEIVANSLEMELAYKSVTLLEGTYKFYDVMEPQKSLIGKVMEYLPNWNIGTIDSDLWDIYRTFDLATESIYTFLMEEVENAYECVFEFDTFNRTISAKANKNAVTKNDIILAYDTVVKQIEIEENADELVTCLEVYGGNDLSIHTVNPLGTSKIYNYSYYKTLNWMSQGLITAIDLWEKKVSDNQLTYSNGLTNIKTKNGELIILKGELTRLEGEYKSLENIQKTRIEQGLDYSDIWSSMVNKEREISSKKVQITSKELEIKTTTDSLKSINQLLSFENNFTKEQLCELDSFTISNVYQNDCFITTDSMDEVDKQKIAQELYDQAKGVLIRVSKPTFSFNMDAVNFLLLKEYEYFTKQLKLGSQITIELSEGEFAFPVLLELNLSFDTDSRTNITMTFGNRLRLNKDDTNFSELFGETVKSSMQVSFDSDKWKQYDKDKESIGAFVNNSLDASKNNVINADNQEITIGANGLRGKRLNPDTGQYDPQQLWLMNKNLVFTKDSFQNVEIGIGEVLLPNGMKDYGINANVILGKLIAGGQFEFSNDGGNFKFDSNGAMLKDATLSVSNSKSNILLDPNNGFKIQKKNGSTVTDSMYMDLDGNLHFKGDLTGSNGTFSGRLEGCEIYGGSLNIGHGSFTVDQSGYCEADSMKIINGDFEGGNLIGTSININNKATINSLGEAKFTKVTIGDAVDGLANIIGASIVGGTIQQLSNEGGILLSGGDMVFTNNYGNPTGTIYYGTGNDGTKMYIQTNGDIPIKIQSGDNMSIAPSTGKNIYMGNTIFTGTVTDAQGNPIGGGKAVFG